MKGVRFLPTLFVVGVIALAGYGGLFPHMESSSAQVQEPKRFQYKIVEVTTETAAMQQLLNEYGAAGWELVAVGLGNMTSPRLIFKR